MKPKIVLIGAGRFGKNHLRNLIQLNNKKKIELIGVVDTDSKLLKRINREYNISTSKNFKEFEKEANAFDIVSPASTHFSIAKYLLNKQKHIFIEKPLGINSNQTKKLVAIGKKNNCVIQVGHIFRYNNAVEQIKREIKLKNNFPYLIKGKFIQTTEPKNDVGSIFNFLHHFDILDNILGVNPEKIYAISNLKSKNSKFEINSSVFLQYKKGLNVSLDLGWVPSGKHRTLELFSKKQHTICDLEKQIIEIHRNKQKSKKRIFSFKEPLGLELNEFIECIKTGKQPKANGIIGHRIVKVAELATRSLNQKKILKFPNSKE
mgnify:FL=1|jgi:UDP-N-acetylglucosamine 3-dehydrogenase